ncbi:MAG: alpha/beta hydrolase [Sneathiella sp.]
MTYSESFYKSNDGLDLYYRKYGKSSSKLPLICLSGLTRNSGDFTEFAEHFSNDRAVYTLDYRGRGKSEYDTDHANYNPQVYLGDIMAFFQATDITKAVFIGTSLGGLLTMGLAGLVPQYVAAAVLNDVGPEVSSDGGERIAGYVGKDVRYPTLAAAIAAQKAQYTGAYPDLDDDEWRHTTEVGYVLDEKAGNFRANYDLALGKALQDQISNDAPIDLWPFFEAMNAIPVLSIRGALSDVLSADVFQKMQDTNPDMTAVTLENRGHVPLLNEPLSMQHLTRFLKNV